MKFPRLMSKAADSCELLEIKNANCPKGIGYCLISKLILQALAPGGRTELNATTLEAIAEEAPSAQLPRAEIVGAPLANVLTSTKLQPSKSASKRLIQVYSCTLHDCTSHEPTLPIQRFKYFGYVYLTTKL